MNCIETKNLEVIIRFIATKCSLHFINFCIASIPNNSHDEFVAIPEDYKSRNTESTSAQQETLQLAAAHSGVADASLLLLTSPHMHP